MSSAAKPTDLNEGDIRRNPGEPDAEQAAASTYNKPRIEWQGLTIAIENPAGSVRRGRNRHGVTWEVRMRFDYGEILGTLGVDGDPVDVILGPNMDAPVVYVVHQRRVNDWESYDEDKCCVGFDSQADAEQAFLSNYNDPRFLGPITAMPVDEFVAKVRATKDKPAMIKAHISGYTRKDGAVVAAHEDKRAKHSPEQMAKWAEEKRQREQANIAASSSERDAQKVRSERMSAQVGASGIGKHFTPDEIESIRGYIRSGDRHGAQAEGRQAAVSAIGRLLASQGMHIEHVSESHGGKSTSLYVKVGGDVVRVSDHELPMTPERQANRERGLTGRWSRDVVITDWQTTTAEEIVADIKGEEMAKAQPMVLFLKAHVGPYLRGGKIVNVAGYQGRPARAHAAPGQHDLFAEPQHTEPTRELIAEHERLVQVLQSPSHEDDKVEAKRQAGELEEYKKDAEATAAKPEKKPTKAKKDDVSIESGEISNSAVAKIGGRVVGHANAWKDSNGDFVIMESAVHPSHRRKGIATTLYQHIERESGRQLKPAISLSDDAFEFWKRYRPEAVAGDLRHIKDQLEGRPASKNGLPGKLTGASGRGVKLVYDNHERPGTHSYLVGAKEINDALEAAGGKRLVPDHMATRYKPKDELKPEAMNKAIVFLRP